MSSTLRTHATEDVAEPVKTLCGRPLPVITEGVPLVLPISPIVNNHDPECKTCLRVKAIRNGHVHTNATSNSV